MKESQNLIVGIGEVLWDCLPEGKEVGGAPANFACHVSQFGLPGCAVSAVGADPLGDELLAELSRRGVRYEMARVPFPTGTVEVTLDAEGVPQYDIRRGVAWDNIPFTAQLEEIARRTRAVCFGSLAQRDEVSGETIARFLDAMPRSADTLRVFDINLRQSFFDRATVSLSMQRCDVLKINDEELVTVSRMFGYPAGDGAEAQCRRLMAEYDLRMVILTCGVNGSYVFTAADTSFLPTPVVEVADTVGAGDSFTAAFIASLLKGATVRDAHDRAVKTSAYVCSCHGAMPKLSPELTEI